MTDGCDQNIVIFGHTASGDVSSEIFSLPCGCSAEGMILGAASQIYIGR